MSYEPTIATVLADAKAAGFVVTKSAATVNGCPAYEVQGRSGLFTKHGLSTLVDSPDSQRSQPALCHYQQLLVSLTRYEWTYEASDDHARWVEGSRTKDELVALQESLDPTFAIWNLFAPPARQNNSRGSWFEYK